MPSQTHVVALCSNNTSITSTTFAQSQISAQDGAVVLPSVSGVFIKVRFTTSLTFWRLVTHGRYFVPSSYINQSGIFNNQMTSIEESLTFLITKLCETGNTKEGIIDICGCCQQRWRRPARWCAAGRRKIQIKSLLVHIASLLC